MAAVPIVFGPQGAGKSTDARTLAALSGATRFSIWGTAEQIAKNGGNVVLDLGFMKARNRSAFAERARDAGISSELHFVAAPHDIRRGRVLTRNAAQGETFSFEVSPAMFDFMKKEFEVPTDIELASATVFHSDGTAA
ncbi:AAA family ATPase [Burkholderia sp. BCC0322]|uniref:AAA family ATPase n=1 Tax=unclassified Burkholderia TaxID=2613784 RepID=UPI001588926D|nr:AAA family ATPase [Burkholderia sp. BCC0322]